MKKLSFYARRAPDDDSIIPGSAGVYPIYILSLSFKEFFATHLSELVLFDINVKRKDPSCIRFDPKLFAKTLHSILDVTYAFPVSVQVSRENELFLIRIDREDEKYSREQLSAIDTSFSSDISLCDGSIRIALPLASEKDIVAHAVSVAHIASEIELNFLDFDEK